MGRTRNELTNDELLNIGELGSITGPKVIYINDSGVYEGLTLGAGESIRRNATDTAFEVYTPSAGGGTPGGNDTEVQFNDGGSFGGDSTFTFNKSTNVLTVASITDGTTTLTGGNLQGVTAINATTKSTIQSAITALANLTSIQSQTVTFGGTLNVEANSRINQDLTSDATATFAGVTTTGNVGRDTDNYIGFGVDNSLAIKIGGVASAITSISTGTSDNDKLVTQGYVDDNSGTGTVDTSGTPVDNDFAKFTDANTIEGRSYSEVKTDLSLNNVENTALSTWAGSANITTLGTVTSGTISTGAVLKDVTMTLGSDADGDVYYRASNKLTRLPKGTAAQVLTMNGGATAPEWANAASGFSDPMTTRGDIIYKNAAGTTTRLGAGTVGQVLTSDGTDIAWDDAAAGGGSEVQVFSYSGEVPQSNLWFIPITGAKTISKVTISSPLIPAAGQTFDVQVYFMDSTDNAAPTSTDSVFTSDAALQIDSSTTQSGGLYVENTTAIDNGTYAAGDTMVIAVTDNNSDGSPTLANLSVIIEF